MSDPSLAAKLSIVRDSLPAHADDVGEALAEPFRLSARGVADRRSAFRTPTVATVGPDGAPRVRTMVLRRFDQAARHLVVHTDLRASKAADVALAPRVAVHVYDARAALQVRLSATAELHAGDEIARGAWAASAPASRAVYAISPPPGTEVCTPSPAPASQEASFVNFAVLVLRFDMLEWLSVHRGRHRRARFTWFADGSLHSAWLVP